MILHSAGRRITMDDLRNNRRLREFVAVRKYIKILRIAGLLLLIYFIVHGV